jgi:hypothetical protein
VHDRFGQAVHVIEHPLDAHPVDRARVEVAEALDRA